MAEAIEKRTESSSRGGRMDPHGQAMPNRSRTAAPTSLCAKTDGAAGASPHDRGSAETGVYLGKGLDRYLLTAHCVAEGPGFDKRVWSAIR